MRSSTLNILTLSLLLFSTAINQANAQKSDSLQLAELSAELDALLSNEEDSLSLFGLIDSLLAVDQSSSFLSMSMSYSNRVTSAGRSFGIDQQGLTPGISYYHQSGLFGDVTGIWNSELDPKYFATIATAGYMGQLGKKWSYSLSYDHTFFNTNNEFDTYSLTNALSGGINVDLKYAYASMDYAFSFGGGETSNQLIWSLAGKFKKRTFKPFKSITFMPTFSILMGNQNLLLEYYDVNREDRLTNLSAEDFQRIADRNNWSDRKRLGAQRLFDAVNSPNPTDRQRAFLQEYFSTQEEVNYFGVLNYYLSFPISLTTNKLGILVSYNYNIPQELTGSEYSSEKTGYFGFTVSYNIGL